MDKLFNGIVKFREEDFEAHKDLFESLGRNQKPHTLFIGCADSRVVPAMITRALPGELFIVRNVANIVPPYRDTEEHAGTTSSIEYAVQALEVENIVVCGHSNCGGCAAMNLPDEELAHLPHVRRWLTISKEVKERVDSKIGSGSAQKREWMTEQINILVQMRNLMTYPYVKERYQQGRLKIYGLYYIIETGEVFNFNEKTETFELVEDS
jgi:carbonic anhydrase